MKKIRWNPEKSQNILDNPDRGLSLEMIAELIQSGSVIAIEKSTKYPDQRCFVVSVGDDVWCVPFKEDDESVFLITAWPDRKPKKIYQMKKSQKPTNHIEDEWMNDIEEERTVRDEAVEKRLFGKMIVDSSLKKTHPVSVRIPNSDLEAIQIRAAKDGIPYQTLIKPILHKFATNQIVI